MVKCCKNCRYCEQFTDNYLCKEPHSNTLLMSKNTAVITCCNNFEPNTTEYVGENSIPSFLWLVVFIFVFVYALYAILEYSGIINYLSGLI